MMTVYRPAWALLLTCVALNSAHAQNASATIALTQPVAAAAPAVAQPVEANEPKTRKKAAKTKPQRSQLDIDPRAAIKDTPAPAIDLPGVMKIDGADPNALDMTRTRIFPFMNGAIRSIPVSVEQQNLIQLPFKNPHLRGTDALDIDKHGDSNNVFFGFDPEVEATPVLLWIEGPNHITMGLELQPSHIPGQIILLPDSEGLFNGAAAKRRAESYITQVQTLMESAALGGAPNGYTSIDLKRDRGLGPIGMNGIVVQPLRQFSSLENDLFVYEVTNPGPKTATLRESEFKSPNVAAVSIFPVPTIAPGEATKVFVLTRKERAQ